MPNKSMIQFKARISYFPRAPMPALLALATFLTGFLLSGGTAAQEAGAATATEIMNRLQARKPEYQRPCVIRFEGVIDEINGDFLRSRLARARSAGADLLILEIDSPGGLVSESLALAEALRDIDWAYTVAWIPREAISGAALMSLGCDEIVMGEQARFGDAGPIEFDPLLASFRHAPAKIKSMLVRHARDLAVAKGRPPELAEAMVDENAVVYTRVTGDPAAGGKREFRVVLLDENTTDPQDAARRDGVDTNDWSMVAETGKDRILTVNGAVAVELGLANYLSKDMAELISNLKAKGEPVVYEYNFADRVVAWLTHPLITALLVIVGLIALYIELSAPGLGLGGLLAGLCAALFFWSRFFGGTAGWLEVILFLAGVVFVLMELFVLPGFGVSGILGLILLLTSLVMAMQDFVIPGNESQWKELTQTLCLVLGSFCVFLVGAAFISRRLGSIPVLGSLALKPPEERQETFVDKETGKRTPQPHPLVAVGDWGLAETLLRPAGRALFNGRSIDVVSDGSFVAPGAQIRVVDISGNRILVERIEEPETVAN
jgi:membrane-bound serine protease (ClpP class)